MHHKEVWKEKLKLIFILLKCTGYKGLFEGSVKDVTADGNFIDTVWFIQIS